MPTTNIPQRVAKKSGFIYVSKHSDEDPFPIPEDIGSASTEQYTAIEEWLKKKCVDENELGYIKNGIDITETLSSNIDQPDMGQMKVTIISDEQGSASLALFNFNGETLSKIHSLTVSTQASETGQRLTLVGGISNEDDSSYDVIFVNPDSENGDLVVVMRGQNIEGLTLSFKPNEVTPLPVNYSALTLDSTGRLFAVYEMPKGFKWDNTYNAARAIALSNQLKNVRVPAPSALTGASKATGNS